MIKLFNRWLPVLVWSGVIYYFSSLSVLQSAAINWLDFIFKKSAHVTEYAILYLLLARALSSQNKLHHAFYLGLAYAFSDEIHQLFTPGRGATIRDILVFDAAGLVIGFFLAAKSKVSKYLV